MFEDSLVESTGRIRTRSRYFAAGSAALQSMLLAALAIYPFLHPATLPRQALTMLLAAPPVPPAPANLPQRAASPTRSQPFIIINPLGTPTRIPQHVSMQPDTGTPPAGIDTGLGKTGQGTDGGIFSNLCTSTPPVVRSATPKGPLHISSGVAAGRLITPIQPLYPAIARAARIEGTVVVQAVISKDGRIEGLHIVSGPSMLQRAAIEAIQRARYRPFVLNGEPVAVETTINIVFQMGG